MLGELGQEKSGVKIRKAVRKIEMLSDPVSRLLPLRKEDIGSDLPGGWAIVVSQQ